MSSTAVVEIVGLTKKFGDVTAVEDLSFSVMSGQVCGLLGPNGAGKTTSLRVLLGLERPTEGSVNLFGEPARAGSLKLLRVGALIEQACFVPHLSGMTNLKLWWESGGRPMAEADLDTALDIAGLGDAIDRKVKTYSQGMKQRLGFARLLLCKPDLLVLDEPTNGLDPGEIREIRQMLKAFADNGATVLVSSHHLNEVEQSCTHAVVMNEGKLVKAGLVADLIGTGATVYLEVDDRFRATQMLNNLAIVERVVDQGDGLDVTMTDGQRSDLVVALVAGGIRVETITAQQHLEDAFLDLIANRDQ